MKTPSDACPFCNLPGASILRKQHDKPSMGDSEANDDALDPDQKAAHQFLTELRTRIATQPLPYQHGVEARGLESLWEVFGQAREAAKKYPGCEQFAARATAMLNLHLRPVTAKWHQAYEDGRLKSRDGADEFRADLETVQDALRGFARELHRMAYGSEDTDQPMPGIWQQDAAAARFTALFQPVRFGIPGGWQVDDAQAAEINRAEAAAVRDRRSAGQSSAAVAPEHDAFGLALSGGGIRSATFGLGVVQVLAARGFLSQVDFLSTVSGGGYTGSFLTRRLGEFSSEGATGETILDREKGVAFPEGPDTGPIRYLRQNAKFLAAYNLKDRWGMVTSTLAGMVLNWMVPMLFVVLAALLADVLGRLPRVDEAAVSAFPGVMAVFGTLTLVALIGYAASLRHGAKATTFAGRVLALVLALSAVTGVVWGGALRWHGFPGWMVTHRKISSGAFALVVMAVPSILRFLPVLKNVRVRKIVLTGSLALAAFVLPVVLLASFAIACRVGGGPYGLRILGGTALLLLIVDLFFLNINLTSPHRLYRAGLARTFVQKSAADNEDLPLKNINATGTAPYHLINCALNIPGSQHPALRDRKCDFFLFSKCYSGSPSTGYLPTACWQENGHDIGLATAMAISGAAFSSYMGLGSFPTLTALLTFLNVRLGFWIARPGRSRTPHPGFACLLRETLGLGMTEKAAWLNLSDGGHVENMAVYELLRRRCKFILCVDGEADPNFTFEGLMTVVRHAQIDFGISIHPKLGEVRSDPASGVSRAHGKLCVIRYPACAETKDGVAARPEEQGLLLYVKLSVTGNETELIKRYRINHPDFPHQSTLDQFFDQEQFEAYRQLGTHVAQGLFAPAVTSHTNPETVADWYRCLARNLLEPEQTAA